MNQVKSLLNFLADIVTAETVGDALWESEVRLFVDATGIPHVRAQHAVTEGSHGFLQAEVPELSVDLLAEFQGDAGAIGPDLRRPSRHIRIIPGVLSGEPHIEHTRIDTRSIDSLRRRGFSVEEIAELYPATTRAQINEAIALERRLTTNERSLAA